MGQHNLFFKLMDRFNEDTDMNTLFHTLSDV